MIRSLILLLLLSACHSGQPNPTPGPTPCKKFCRIEHGGCNDDSEPSVYMEQVPLKLSTGKSVFGMRFWLTGPHIIEQLSFQADYKGKLTKKELKEIQKKLGYDPEGYGFFNVRRYLTRRGGYSYDWDSNTGCGK